MRISVHLFTLVKKLAGPDSDLGEQGIHRGPELVGWPRRMPGQYRGVRMELSSSPSSSTWNLPYMLLPYLNVLQPTALYLNKNNGGTNSPWHL